ncbi:hypothetical protein Tco_0154910 [Tanacetum coccineum]
MDPMISLGQKNTLAEYMILSGADNRPPMLDKDLYDSWKSRMEYTLQIREPQKNVILESSLKKVLYLSYSLKTRSDQKRRTMQNYLLAEKIQANLTSSNPRNQATIQDGRVIVQQVQGREGQNYSGNTYKSNATSSRGNTTSGQARVVKCYNCQGEGHMARQCTQSKRPRNATWYKEKAMLAEAQEAGKILDEEQLAFLADPGIPTDQAQTIIPHNAAF